MSNIGRVGNGEGEREQRTETALTVFNPNLPINHMNIMQEVQTKRSARIEEAKQLSKMGGVNIKERAKQLAPHVDKLVAERKELDKWNLNAEGRNQGLVHIIDYAYAPPPRSSNKELSEMLSHKSMTGRQIRQEMGLSTAELPKFLGKDVISGDGGKNPSLTRGGKKLSTQLSTLDSRMKSMMSVSNEKKREVANSNEYKYMKFEKEGLEEDIRDRTFYSLVPDESKKGRIPLVEKSAGMTKGDFKKVTNDNPHGSEIVGVTHELDRLMSDVSTKKTPQPNTGGSTFTAKEAWVKTGTHTNGRAKWELKTNQTFPNTAVSTQVETNSNGSKLKVMRWGTASGKEKYSTVMGSK